MLCCRVCKVCGSKYLRHANRKISFLCEIGFFSELVDINCLCFLISLNNCSWHHLHGNFHMPLAEKPITSCQAMNLSLHVWPGRLLNGCGGSDDSTSDSCLCMTVEFQHCMTACTVGLSCCRVAVPAVQGAPGWRYGNYSCWTAQLGMERICSSFGPHPFFIAEVEWKCVIITGQ